MVSGVYIFILYEHFSRIKCANTCVISTNTPIVFIVDLFFSRCCWDKFGQDSKKWGKKKMIINFYRFGVSAIRVQYFDREPK